MHLEAFNQPDMELRSDGRDQARLEMHMDATFEQDWRRTWRRSMGAMPNAETLFMS